VSEDARGDGLTTAQFIASRVIDGNGHDLGGDATLQDPELDVLEYLERGETGDAKLLATIYEGKLAYDHSLREWYIWQGHYWQQDRVGLAYDLVSNQIAALYLETAADLRKQGKNELSQSCTTRANRLRDRRRVDNVLYLAARPYLGITGDEWDRDPWVLGCTNGVVDLRDGSFRDGKPGDFIKSVCPTEWVGIDTPCSLWEQFLSDVFKGDPDLIAFVQRLLGYALTGLTWEHVFPILHGDGRNGKDTLLETLRRVLGASIATTSEADALMSVGKEQSNGPKPFVYDMRGKRLVWCSESKEGRRLDVGLLKRLTGGNTLKVRTLHSKPIEFEPSHLVLLVTNHKPHITADDQAIWDRVHLIPFKQRFVDDPNQGEKQKDPEMKEKLIGEAPGILAWLVRGCLAWRCQGLQPPAIVKVATEEYRGEEDTIGQFIEERCITGQQYEVKAGDLYKVYQDWAKEYGMQTMSLTAFGKRIKRKFSSRLSAGVIYEGLGLLAT